MAKSERISLNQFINVCVAEKLSALRTEAYFQEGIRRVECAIALRILDRSGDRIPPKKIPENSSHWRTSEETEEPSRPAAPPLRRP